MSDRTSLRRGFLMSLDEMMQLGAEPRVGVRFHTDRLELFPAMFEVVELDERRVVVRRVHWMPRPAL